MIRILRSGCILEKKKVVNPHSQSISWCNVKSADTLKVTFMTTFHWTKMYKIPYATSLMAKITMIIYHCKRYATAIFHQTAAIFGRK